jgi:cytochrome c
VFDYIRRAMPFQAPESLTNDEVYALTAYLLAMNGIIDEDDEMSARTLARVRMPNRDGFILAYPERVRR